MLLVLALALAACSDSPAGSGKNPPLSKGADEFMKTYGGVESGVTDTGDKKPDKGAKKEEKPPQEKK